MKWSDIPFHPTGKALRQFAAAWLVFFLAVGTYQYVVRGHQRWGLTLILLAIAVSVLGLVRPAAVRWIFVGWMVLAFPIGWLLSQIMLLLLFYGVITPVALLFRFRGRDMLRSKPAPNRPTYWLPKQTPQDVTSYFHQY